MAQQLKPMRETLQKKGMSIEAYVESNDVSVPEALMDAWNAVPAPVSQGRSFSEDAETSMLAREAMQAVSTTNVDIEGLRDILAARTEAAQLGITLPEMSREQKEGLDFWASSRNTQASSLAKTILSRN
jgi:hypothetical protein